MRILCSVSDQAWGGKQQYMYHFAQALWDAGHDLVMVGESGGELVERLLREGLPVAAVEGFTDLAGPATGEIADLLDKGTDVAIATGRRDYLMMHRAIQRARSPVRLVLVRLSGFPIEHSDDYLRVYESADAIVVLCMQQVDNQFADLIRRGILDRGRFVEFRTGVDVKRFAPRPPDPEILRELSLTGEETVVSCVARLSWEKDHATLLRAFAKVAGDRPDFALLLIGDGELDGELAGLGRQLGLGDRLKRVGHREDVPELLSVCRVNVLASICEETGALALQEAMAMEIPVIGPRRGIIPDYVRHGETGYLFEPGDADDLARWLALLVEDTERTRTLARNGRREILERFDLEDQKVRFCRFLEELHAGGKGEARSGLLKTQN